MRFSLSLRQPGISVGRMAVLMRSLIHEQGSEKAPQMERHMERLNVSPPAVAGGTAWRIGSLRRSPDRGASERVGCKEAGAGARLSVFAAPGDAADGPLSRAPCPARSATHRLVTHLPRQNSESFRLSSRCSPLWLADYQKLRLSLLPDFLINYPLTFGVEAEMERDGYGQDNR